MGNGESSISGLTAEQRREMLRKLLARKAEKPQTFPLSLAQEALWFLDQLDPGRPTYSLYPAARVRGNLNLKVLEQAIGEIVRRHDTLRTAFPEVDGSPVQTIASMTPYELPIVDLSGLPPDEREEEARRIAEARPPIDLQKGPVFRSQVLRLGEGDYVLMLQIHHIVFDGWSLGVIAREMVALYRAFSEGQPSPLPELPVRYADFASWQRKRLQGETLEKMCHYWRQQLDGLPPLDLPTDYPRPAIRTSRGHMVPFKFAPELTQAVTDFSRSERVTTFMTLLAGFQELLHRYSGQEDFALGTPIANRRQKNIEPLIGYFINMLVLRSDLSGDPTFRELVQRVRQTALDAYEHQELTLDKVVEAVQPERDMSRHPLFQIMFVLQNNRRPPIKLTNLQVAPMDNLQREKTAKFEMTVPLRMTPEGLQGKINFNTDLFATETIERMIGHYLMILADALAEPDRPLSQLRLLNDAERQTVLVDWNATDLDYPETAGVIELFESHAERTPDAEAVVDGGQRWTYRELNERANQLARYLQRQGVGPEVAVGICIERSPELFMAILAVMKAGGAYVPLDPAYSRDAQERLTFILQDANVSVVVTDSSVADSLGVNETHTNPTRKRGTGDTASPSLARRVSVGAVQNAQPALIILDREAAAIESESRENVGGSATAENLAYIIFTSGSTGRPKGVMVTRDNLLNAYHGWEQDYHLGTELTTHLQMASFGFDVFSGDWVRALGSGGKLVICRKEILLSAAELFDLMRREEVDAAEFVPVVLRNLVQHLETSQQRLDFMRLVIVGSDAWYVEDHKQAQEVLGPQTRLINSYGLTETTIDSSYFEGDVRALPDTGMVPIGRPFANVRLYVLDKHQRPVPVGVTGELYIGGKGVARGYVNRPDLDEERFLKDPFAASPDARMCRTGDRARWRTDGRLDFLGRADDQVKIRGFRIEPGEVEEVLREHPLLTEAAVLARERGPGDLHLVAYVSGSNGDEVTVAEMRRYLTGRLPEYMIPSMFVSLDVMPTTSSGKVDRQALPPPDWSRSALQGEYVAPRTPIETQLTEIWSQVLGIDRVGVNDNFFDLGGNSLLALRLTARVRIAFSVDLPLVTLFASPTLTELSEKITELQAQGPIPEAPPIRRLARKTAPLSFAQEQFWFVQQLFPGMPIDNMHATLQITGPLDLDTMRDTMGEIGRRHDSLRTTFEIGEDREPMQVIARELKVDVSVEDLSDLAPEEHEDHIRKLSREQGSKAFDTSTLPLFRVRLLRLGENEHRLLVTTTHIMFDGWSLQVLTREVAEIYEAFRAGQPSPLPELPVQYPDYAVWQREYIQGDVLEAMLDYWRKKLDGVTSPLLPTDRSRQTGARHLKRAYGFHISADLRARLDRLARSEDATLYVICLAAFKVLLQRYCGLDDIAVVTPMSNRRRPEIQRLMGVFVNSVILRTDFSGDPTFREMLSRVRDTALEGFERQELPFGHLVADLAPDHDVTRYPLVQVMFNYIQRIATKRPPRRRELEFGRERMERDPVATRFDLLLTLAESGHQLRGALNYDGALFDRETIERLEGHFQTLLAEIVADPDRPISQLPMLPESERQQLLVDWNDTSTEYPRDKCVYQLFEEQVERTPDAVAVVFENQQLTYRELNTRANQLAHHLLGLGVQPDQLVGICVERSLEMVVGLLGVLKAGAGYLPLEPDTPQQRLEFVLQDADVHTLLTQRFVAARLSLATDRIVLLDSDSFSRHHHSNPPSVATTDKLAYVIYTSGSTGKPKGVMIEHRQIVSYVLGILSRIDFPPGCSFAMVQPLTVDACKTTIFSALATGGQLHILSREISLNADALGEYMQRHEIDYVKIAPSHLEVLQSSAAPERLMPRKWLITGGEFSRGPWAAQLQSMNSTCEIINHYGPTETTVGVLTFDLNSSPRPVDEYRTVPIGRPLPNVRAYVLDQARQPVPVGVPGELCIGGSYVARGYLNRPELTARAFVPDTFSGNPRERIYRTGDLVRWLPDGNIEFLGRTDDQVKIRGIRIEPREIELVLQQHKLVRAALVMPRTDASGGQRLVAYVVPHRKESVTPGELREVAEQKLPTNMVPTAFVLLDEFPLNRHGKVDRHALPDASDERRPDLTAEFVAPRNDVERQLAEIWQEVLGVDRVGVHDDFFEIGGHSLLVIRIVARVRSQMGVVVPVAAFFAEPTVAAFAQEVEAAQRGETVDQPPVMQVVKEIAASIAAQPNAGGESLVQLRAGGPDTPLFCVHGLGGHVAAFMPLATELAAQRSVYGLQGQGLDPGQQPHECVEDMAAYYLDEIREVQAGGPYLLAGWSMGGLIALEMAQRLTAAGEEVTLLAMLDTHLAATKRDLEELNDAAVMRWVAPHLNIPYKQIKKLPFEQQWALIEEKAQQEAGIAAATIRRLANVCKAHLAANSQYTPQPYAGPTVLLRAKQARRRRLDNRWKSICPQLRVEQVPGSHYSMLQKPDVDVLAERLGRLLHSSGAGR